MRITLCCQYRLQSFVFEHFLLVVCRVIFSMKKICLGSKMFEKHWPRGLSPPLAHLGSWCWTHILHVFGTCDIASAGFVGCMVLVQRILALTLNNLGHSDPIWQSDHCCLCNIFLELKLNNLATSRFFVHKSLIPALIRDKKNSASFPWAFLGKHVKLIDKNLILVKIDFFLVKLYFKTWVFDKIS